MTIQNIMVPFQSEEAGAVAFRAAAVFARHFKAHLDVLHIRRRFPVPAGNYYYPIAGGYIEQNRSVAATNADRLAAELKELYAKLCREGGVAPLDDADHDESMGATASWSDLDTDYSFDFAIRARLADLAVAARPERTAIDDDMALIEELIFQSARPVLLADKSCADAPFPKTVAVAWDGGREAAHALSATMPILKEAETVAVISVGGIKRTTEPPERASGYLRLHGVRALHAHPEPRKGQSVEVRFLEEAEHKGADLIVMGAYSHSRWREVVLGGFTRRILNHAGVRVVMTH